MTSETIPDRYNVQSELKADVKKGGSNQFDFGTSRARAAQRRGGPKSPCTIPGGRGSCRAMTRLGRSLALPNQAKPFSIRRRERYEPNHHRRSRNRQGRRDAGAGREAERASRPGAGGHSTVAGPDERLVVAALGHDPGTTEGARSRSPKRRADRGPRAQLRREMDEEILQAIKLQEECRKARSEGEQPREPRG